MNKLNKIAALEKAIAEKYGKEAIQNPKEYMLFTTHMFVITN